MYGTTRLSQFRCVLLRVSEESRFSGDYKSLGETRVHVGGELRDNESSKKSSDVDIFLLTENRGGASVIPLFYSQR